MVREKYRKYFVDVDKVTHNIKKNIVANCRPPHKTATGFRGGGFKNEHA